MNDKETLVRAIQIINAVKGFYSATDFTTKERRSEVIEVSDEVVKNLTKMSEQL